MNDQDILEKLLPIALGLLEFNRKDKCYQWGENLYQIYKYLEDRLNNASETNEPVKQEIQVKEKVSEFSDTLEEIKQDTKEDNQSKIVNVFHGVTTVNIYNQ